MNRHGLRSAAVAAAIIFLVGISAPAEAKPGGVPAIPLNTEQEVTGSNTGASGFFSYEITGGQLCYTLRARDLSAPPSAAHIHLAPRNAAGDVVVPLTVGSGTDWTVEACTRPSSAVLAAIKASPPELLRQRPHPNVPRRGDPRPAQVGSGFDPFKSPTASRP